MPVRNHMHKQTSFVDRAVGYAETAGKIASVVNTMYQVGRGIGTAVRIAAPLLAL